MNVLREAILRKNGYLATSGSDPGATRAYAVGEDVRRIHWKATARTGTAQVAIRVPEMCITWAAIVDGSPSMSVGRERSIESSAQEALSLWRYARTEDDRWMPIDIGAAFNCSSAIRFALKRLPGTSALLLVSDQHGVDEVPDDLLTALGRRTDCTALLARDPWGADLPLRGFVEIADVESGAHQTFFITQRERLRYVASVAAAQDRLRARFARARWRFAFFGETNSGRALLNVFSRR